MVAFPEALTLFVWTAAFGVAFLAGAIKGAVGFGMPMVLISGLGSVMVPELALAGLLLPTLTTNMLQSVRGGLGEVPRIVSDFRVFLIVGGIALIVCAQFVVLIPPGALFVTVGSVVALVAFYQLSGAGLRIPARTRVSDFGFGLAAGAMGGVSGVWGPPTVIYLNAIGAPKVDHIRIQGLIYSAGAVLLVGAHIGSGILSSQTWAFSLVLVVPALAGLWIGFRLQDRLDQKTFLRATQLVLILAGLNLIRRGIGLF